MRELIIEPKVVAGIRQYPNKKRILHTLRIRIKRILILKEYFPSLKDFCVIYIKNCRKYNMFVSKINKDWEDKMKKIIVALVILVLSFNVLLVGCQKETEDKTDGKKTDNVGKDDANNTSDVKSDMQVVVSLWEISDFEKVTNELIKDFESSHPNIKIDVTYNSIDAHKNNLKVAAASGSMPGMTIPVQVTLIPLNIMLKSVNLINSRAGLMLIYLGFGIPFGILILRGFFRTIPNEIVEAARIDGCSDFKILVRIILPIAKPAVVTLIILDFLSTWNEFLLSSVFITKEGLKTIPTGLLNFTTQHSTNYGLLNAAVLMSIIPVFAVYIIFQKHFVSGLQGSVKG